MTHIPITPQALQYNTFCLVIQLFLMNLQNLILQIYYDGIVLRIPFTENDTIGNVKEKIKDQIGYPIQSQQLFYDKNILGNEKTLSNYKIISETVLHLGITKNQSYSILGLNSSQSAFLIKDGLVIGFQCKNKECQIFQNIIYQNLGFGQQFHINKLLHKGICPKCQTKTKKGSILGYYKADVKAKGVYDQSGDQYQRTYPCKQHKFEIIEDAIKLSIELSFFQVSSQRTKTKLQQLNTFVEIARGSFEQTPQQAIFQNQQTKGGLLNCGNACFINCVSQILVCLGLDNKIKDKDLDQYIKFLQALSLEKKYIEQRYYKLFSELVKCNFLDLRNSSSLQKLSSSDFNDLFFLFQQSDVSEKLFYLFQHYLKQEVSYEIKSKQVRICINTKKQIELKAQLSNLITLQMDQTKKISEIWRKKQAKRQIVQDFQCSHCNSNNHQTYLHQYISFGSVLVFNLTKSSKNSANQRLLKIEETLDIKQICRQRYKGNLSYSAIAFIFYIGNNISGHYKGCYKKKGKWYLIDDNKVQQLGYQINERGYQDIKYAIYKKN